MPVLRLAVPSPLRKLFDYLPPSGMDPSACSALQPGTRIRVPFGSREVVAILVAVVDTGERPTDKLKPALQILDQHSLLPPSLFALCQWAAAYYQHPPGEVFLAAYPAKLRKGEPAPDPGEPGWCLSERGKGLPDGALARSPKQALALQMLQTASFIPAPRFPEQGIGSGILRALEKKELIERCSQPLAAPPPSWGQGLALNPEQQEVVTALEGALGSFGCHLLEGVTGSGKTEVYLQLIAACLQRGQQALVLIPEIGLTPQTLDRFRARFDARIEVLHSGLSDRERALAWNNARLGHAHIVLGTRSAIFTPLASPGLIVVDEEHDGSFKQQDGFRYCARDIAVKRGQLEGCPVLLGSATPSLESLHNALAGRYSHHLLPRRAGAASLPSLEAVDVRRQPLQGGLSDALAGAVRTALEGGQQVLLFLNRRGYAPALQCHDCGWIAGCDHCDARLTVHRRQRRLRCHHCSAARPLPAQCPQCHSERLLTNGLGTEQTEEVLRQLFPSWPTYRVDSDSMTSQGAMPALIDEVQTGKPCILLGTQMLTKGHHFPGVALVGVLDADALLFSADFRGEERMAQLLTQVAGRAGREGLAGRVLLQTHHPDHPALQAMLSRSFGEQARDLLQNRLQTGLPPAGQMLVIRCDSQDPAAGEQFLHQLRRKATVSMPPRVSMIGPLPSALPRRAGKFRCQLTVLASDRGAAQQAARCLVAVAETLRSPGDLRWSIDVDPTEVM